ncbi:hypothetical protein HAV15_012265 [Penicillium sp. str. |nr:hypothetical protein HAV15_012265 [Penicillium sp. str. \
MVELTVSQVAGIIAALVFVGKWCVFNCFFLSYWGIVDRYPEAGEQPHNMVGCEPVPPPSYWPNILGSDSFASRERSQASPCCHLVKASLILGLVGIAAIVTPIGLYDAISLDSSGTHDCIGFESFVWTVSASSMQRFEYNPSLELHPWDELENYDYTLPAKVVETFTGGLSDFDESVSSLFDIQWRTYSSSTLNDDGPRFLIGAYRQIQSLLLNGAIDVVEGLIVDTKSGGIGLRNHSTPSPHVHGSACDEVENLALVDRGGFVNLHTGEPMVDNDISPANAIDLHSRAYRAAWANNVYTMAFLNDESLPNTTNYLDSEIGKNFPLHEEFTNQYGQRDRIHTWPEFGRYFGSLPRRLFNGTVPSLVNTTGSLVSNYTNPFNISQNDFDLALTQCKGTNGRVVANRSSVAISCGMLFGAPSKRDGTEAILFLPGDRLMMPIYTCASATRAIVKTVDFTYNGTGQLAGLSVAQIEAKDYESEESKPWWSVEITGLPEQEANPIWGALSNLRIGIDQTSFLSSGSGCIYRGTKGMMRALIRICRIFPELTSTHAMTNAVTGTRGWHTQAASANSADDENAGGTFVRKFNRRIHSPVGLWHPRFHCIVVDLAGDRDLCSSSFWVEARLSL